MNYGITSIVEQMRIINAQASNEAWMIVGFGFIAFWIIALAVWGFAKAWSVLRTVLTRKELIAFALIGGVCCWAAQKRLITFPYTDPTQHYLTDDGSYVDTDTDTVHINFNRIIAPSSAKVYIDYCERGTNNTLGVDANWQHKLVSTFGELQLPYEFTHPNATNYAWIVYTDWIPPSAVETNGVWHALWGKDVAKRNIIPVRTVVKLDNDVIATPKSKLEYVRLPSAHNRKLDEIRFNIKAHNEAVDNEAN